MTMTMIDDDDDTNMSAGGYVPLEVDLVQC